MRYFLKAVLAFRFLFHTGSIKSEVTAFPKVKRNDVSIPYWFD